MTLSIIWTNGGEIPNAHAMDIKIHPMKIIVNI